MKEAMHNKAAYEFQKVKKQGLTVNIQTTHWIGLLRAINFFV